MQTHSYCQLPKTKTADVGVEDNVMGSQEEAMEVNNGDNKADNVIEQNKDILEEGANKLTEGKTVEALEKGNAEAPKETGASLGDLSSPSKTIPAEVLKPWSSPLCVKVCCH